MPNVEFLQDEPLYKKFVFTMSEDYGNLPKVNLNMYCPKCKDKRTFKFNTHQNYTKRKNFYLEYSGGRTPTPFEENDIIVLNDNYFTRKLK